MKTITKFLEQKCIGYQRDSDGSVYGSVIQSNVLFSDGTQGTLYSVTYSHYNEQSGTYCTRATQWSERCPRVDTAN